MKTATIAEQRTQQPLVKRDKRQNKAAHNLSDAETVAADGQLGYNTRPPKDNGEEYGHFNEKIERREGEKAGCEEGRVAQTESAREEAGGEEGGCSGASRETRSKGRDEDGLESCN